MAKVAVLFEFSGRVRDAFIAEGHEATSFDLLPSESPNGPHVIGDIYAIPYEEWRRFDLIIAHPPCTYLTVSGARYFAQRQVEQRLDLCNIRRVMALPVPHLALENPVGVISTHIRKPDQIFQPYQFGEDASKKTCLWLRGLPRLQPTNLVLPNVRTGRYANQTPGGHNKYGPSPDRWKNRSRTFKGVAEAMAVQWGRYVEYEKGRQVCDEDEEDNSR